MNIFNFLPKRIDLTKYYDSLPEELIENISLDRDGEEKYGYLRLSTTNDQEHFRLSYTVYGCEGGASGYFPLSEEDIYEGSKGKFVSVFSGGFIGDNVEELAKQLYNWCRENGYQ